MRTPISQTPWTFPSFPASRHTRARGGGEPSLPDDRVDAPLRVLLVEDNPGDADLVRERLEGLAFEIAHETRLENGIARALREGPDVVLLDLNLPDSDGLASVDTFLRRAPGIPIVVLTVLHSEELGVTAVDMGAQDYLVKEQVDRPLLTRALRFAALRHATSAATARRAGSLAEEVARLRALLGARSEGPRGPLRERAPVAFEYIVERFRARVLDDPDDPRSGVGVARMLADLSAGPRDVMDVYAQVAQELAAETQERGDYEDLASRARFRALELMGRLVELYGAAGSHRVERPEAG